MVKPMFSQLAGTGHPLAKYPGAVGRSPGGYNPHQQGSQGSQFWQQQQSAAANMRGPQFPLGGQAPPLGQSPGGFGQRPPPISSPMKPPSGGGFWGGRDPLSPGGSPQPSVPGPSGGAAPNNHAWYQGPKQEGMMYTFGAGGPGGSQGGYQPPANAAWYQGPKKPDGRYMASRPSWQQGSLQNMMGIQ